MRSGKSYVNRTILHKNLGRFWPVWSVWLAFLTFLLPLRVLVLMDNRYAIDKLEYLTGSIYDMLGDPGMLLLLAGFAVLTAMAVFSYLYSARSVQMLHALPVTRECLFLTNYLSGLLFLVGPILITGVALLVVVGGSLAGVVGLWTLLCTLQAFFFYSLAVFCAMFTGHILALPAFYLLVNCLPLVLIQVGDGLFRQFIYGYQSPDWMNVLNRWLTPLIMMYDVRYSSDGAPKFGGIPTLLFYAAVGVVLALVAVVAYHKRRLESAGDVVSIRWVKPIFKYGVALTSSVTLGLLTYQMFYMLLPQSRWLTMLFLLGMGVVGYFAAEMLLKKSFKVFRRSWKGAVVLCVGLTLVCCAMEFDLIGYNRVPAGRGVESVEIYGLRTMPEDDGSYINMKLRDPEDIDTILRLHQELVESKELARQAPWVRSADSESVALEDGQSVYVERERWVNLYLEYTLVSGRRVSRAYNLPLYAADLDREGSAAALLTELVNQPDQVENSYFIGLEENAVLVSAGMTVYDTAGGGYVTTYLEAEPEREHLLEAIRQDLADGSLGRRYLFHDLARQQNCSVGDIRLEFYVPSQGQTEYGYAEKETSWSITITPQTTAKRTLAALEELGVLDETHIMVTHADEGAIISAYPGQTDLETGAEKTMLVPDRS